MVIKHKKYHVEPAEMFCPVCGEDLEMTAEPGKWVCVSNENHYQELNNLSICESQNCNILIVSSNGKFCSLEERFCDNIDEEKEIYIHNGYGYYYDKLSCLELARKGILKTKVEKGIHLTCLECNGQFRLNEDGHLICKDCASEIESNISLYLGPIYSESSIENELVKKIKI